MGVAAERRQRCHQRRDFVQRPCQRDDDADGSQHRIGCHRGAAQLPCAKHGDRQHGIADTRNHTTTATYESMHA